MTRQNMSKHLDWVDGLKGISAIIVVLQHTFVTIFGLSVSDNFRIPVVHNLWDGNFAVSVFIILSTILTCHGIEKHRKELIKRYRYIVLKRYFRLVVPVGVIIVMMYLLNLAGLFYAEEFGAKTNNCWLMNSTETLIHLPGNILCAPLGGCYTILRVGWMLKYVFLGTMWVVILDLLLAERKNSSKLFYWLFVLILLGNVISIILMWYLVMPFIHLEMNCDMGGQRNIFFCSFSY